MSKPICVVRKLFKYESMHANCHACIALGVHKHFFEVYVESYLDFNDDRLIFPDIHVQDGNIASEVEKHLEEISKENFSVLQYFIDTIDGNPFDSQLLIKKYNELPERTIRMSID